MTKQLSDKQVQACENAVGKTCHCRCGGAFHGRGAGGTNADGSIDRAFFESLPDDDPHHMLTGIEKKAAAKKAKRIKQIEKHIAYCERWELHSLKARYETELAELQAA